MEVEFGLRLLFYTVMVSAPPIIIASTICRSISPPLQVWFEDLATEFLNVTKNQ